LKYNGKEIQNKEFGDGKLVVMKKIGRNPFNIIWKHLKKD